MLSVHGMLQHVHATLIVPDFSLHCLTPALAAKSEARRVEAAAAEQLSAMAADLEQAMAAEAAAVADMQRARAAEAARSQQLAEAEEQLLQVSYCRAAAAICAAV
jgi:hypothetical protein